MSAITKSANGAEIQALQVKVSHSNELENTGIRPSDAARHAVLGVLVKQLAYSLADSVITVTKTANETEYALTVYVLTPAQLEKLISERLKA